MANTVRLNDFAVIKLQGEQSHSFLQGQVTCDVNKLKEAEWKAGAQCNAKGKAWSAFLAFEENDSIYLVLTKDSAKVTLAELNKYGVFSKTDITDDSENWFIYGSDVTIDGAKNISLAANHFMVLANSEINGDNGDSSQWWYNEVLSGRAHLFEGAIGEYVPQMLNLQALDYISFNKGCYMGQEMVARMRYLGKNKRALYIAETSTEVELTAGQDVFKAMNGNRRSAGKIINAATFDGKTVLQMVLPKDTELNETIYLDAESELSARLLPLPYSLEQD